MNGEEVKAVLLEQELKALIRHAIRTDKQDPAKWAAIVLYQREYQRMPHDAELHEARRIAYEIKNPVASTEFVI